MPRRLLNSGLSAHRPRTYRRSAPQGQQPAQSPTGDPSGTNPQPAPASPSEGTVQVPEGMTKVKDLEGWVAGDPAKAQAVLDAEQAKPKKDQRVTLVSNMEEVVAAGDLL